MGRREDIHEIVYEEDAQEIPVVEETRVTSSDFDKIKVSSGTRTESACPGPAHCTPIR